MLQHNFDSFESIHFGFAKPQELSEVDAGLIPLLCDSERRSPSFALGRLAAIQSIQKSGYKGIPIVQRGPSGEPIFPQGLCGSISHCTDLAICICAQLSKYRSLGIDLERLDRIVSEDVWNRISTQDERKQEVYSIETALRYFCAKEAIYKAFFPICKKFFGYQAAKLNWQQDLCKISFDPAMGLPSHDFYCKLIKYEHYIIAVCAVDSDKVNSPK